MKLISVKLDENLVCRGFCFIFILSLSLYTYNNSTNMFWADEWDTPGNLLYKEITDKKNIKFNDFYSQHNESRKVIPKFIYFIAFKYGLFDTRIGVILKIILSISSIFFISIIFRSDQERTKTLVLLMSTLLIFIPTQAYNQIFGLQFITIVPSFCLLLIILVNQHIRSTKFCVIISAVICIISTYNYSNGIIIWAIGNPLLFRFFKVKDYKLFDLLLFNGFFLLFTLLYFHNYQHPQHHPGMLKGILHPLRTIKYFTLWLWSPFVIHLPHTKFLCYGLTIGYFFTLIFVTIRLTRSFQKNKNISFSVLCSVMIVMYGLISGCIASLGRSGFGVMAALGPQYPSFALWAHLGLSLLVLTVLTFDQKIFRFSVLTLYALLYAICFESGIKDFKKWNFKMKQCKLTVENLDICPNNPLISDFHPAPETIKLKAKSFADNKLVEFAGNKWLLSTNPKNDPSSGFVTTTINTRTVNLFGWATIPGTKKPADYILVGSTNNNKIVPLSLLSLDVKRTDVNKALNSDDDYLFGFNKTFAIDTLQSEISCYAVDSRNKQIFKLTEF